MQPPQETPAALPRLLHPPQPRWPRHRGSRRGRLRGPAPTGHAGGWGQDGRLAHAATLTEAAQPSRPESLSFLKQGRVNSDAGGHAEFGGRVAQRVPRHAQLLLDVHECQARNAEHRNGGDAQQGSDCGREAEGEDQALAEKPADRTAAFAILVRNRGIGQAGDEMCEALERDKEREDAHDAPGGEGVRVAHVAQHDPDAERANEDRHQPRACPEQRLEQADDGAGHLAPVAGQQAEEHDDREQHECAADDLTPHELRQVRAGRWLGFRRVALP